ncbi:MAG: DUF2059 domain-containing protein [Candidatus Omnitrophota bacterium]
MKKIIIGTIFLLFLSVPVHAEIIYLKDGQVIRAKILERGHYYIKIMDGSIPRQYYMEQIEKIMDEEEPYQWDPNKIDANGFEGISPTKVLLILEHIEAIGARFNIQRNMEFVIEKAPDAQKEKIKELLVITDIVRALIPVYSSVYSEEELRLINGFLKTPAGSKMINSNPEIIKASVEVMADYFRSRLGGKLEL